MDEALNHLGNVLYFLSDLHPDYRCDALDSALVYYNEKRPTEKVEPSGLPLQIIVQQAFEKYEPA